MEKKKEHLAKVWKFQDGSHHFEVNGLVTVEVRDGWVFFISATGTECQNINHQDFINKRGRL